MEKRLTATETNALKMLVHALSAIEDIGKDLAGRFKGAPNAARNFGLARWALKRALDGAVSTVPQVQRETIRRNLEKVEVIVRFRRPWQGEGNEEFGMWISWDAMAAFVAASRSACITCDLNPQAQRKCPLARALDEMPIEKDGTANGCGYFGRL